MVERDDGDGWSALAGGTSSVTSLSVEDLQRLRAILGNCPRAIAVTANDGTLVGYNREFGALFEPPPRLGDAIAALFDPPDDTLIDSVLSASASGQRAGALVRLSASKRVVEWKVATLPAEDGGALGVIVAGDERHGPLYGDYDEITRVKAIEELNSATALDLGRRVLGHELMTHLTALRLAMAGLRREPKQRDRWLEQAEESLDLAIGLLGRKPRAHEGEPLHTAVAPAVAEAIRAVRVGERAAFLAQVRSAVPFGLDVDLPHRELVQVVTNLVSNAVRAVEPLGHEGAVTIFAEPSGLAGYVDVFVRDNGTGIEPRAIGEVFDVGTSSRADGTGHGLGLALVRAIVEDAGGTVRIFSEPEAGTEVTVTLRGAIAGERTSDARVSV